MQKLTQFTVAASGYKTRTETFEGREHLVVPVVALVEGVIHAMNAKNAEFVSASEFSRAPSGWNGRPLFFGHPLNSKGAPVSGNTPDVLEGKSIGRIFNSRIKNAKLAMEAWIDIERAKEIAPEVLERVRDGETIEISVGVFVDTDESEGEFEGRKYLGEWHDIVPDHLALLPKTDEGACSVEMGCGVRAAQEAVVADEKKPERKPTILGRFLQMFRAAQPANEMSSTDLTRKLYETLRAKASNVNYVEAYVPVTDPNRVVYSVYEPAVESGMGYPYTRYLLHERQFTLDANGVITLGDDVVEVEPVLSYEPVLMSEQPDEPTTAKGARNSKTDMEKIQMMHNHAVALGAQCEPKVAAAPKAETGAPCSCGAGNAPTSNSKKEQDMTKEQIAKFMETATEDQMKVLSAAAGEKPAEQPAAAAVPAATTVPTPAPAAPVVAEAAKPQTFDEILATADPVMRDAINEGKRLGEEKRSSTIKALKDTGRCDLTDAVLASKTQAELDSLMKLAGASVPRVDFGGQGGPKDLSAGSKTEVAPPPSMNERILAARAKK